MSGGKGGSGTTIGFNYLFGIHMGLGRGPVDELVAVKVADRIAWQGSVTSSGRVLIENPDLFGGEEKEGGIEGPLDVMMGEPTQVAPQSMHQVFGSPLPGFRRMMTVFFDGLISSMNPYPKKWSFRVRRSTAGWDGPVFRPDLATIVLAGDTV